MNLAALLKTFGEFKKNIQRKNEILTKTPFELLLSNDRLKDLPKQVEK
jgi:hypothetical protein